ncbi:hypothetical protein ABGB05_33895, partial [Plantactinospora sp. B5E13]
RRGSRSGHRILVDCCLTWSLALIDLRARRTHPELQDQLGKDSVIWRGNWPLDDDPTDVGAAAFLAELADHMRAAVAEVEAARRR